MLTRRGRQCHNECLLALADTPPPPPPPPQTSQNSIHSSPLCDDSRRRCCTATGVDVLWLLLTGLFTCASPTRSCRAVGTSSGVSCQMREGRRRDQGPRRPTSLAVQLAAKRLASSKRSHLVVGLRLGSGRTRLRLPAARCVRRSRSTGNTGRPLASRCARPASGTTNSYRRSPRR